MSEILKIDKNGQWSLEKAQVPGSKYPPAAANTSGKPQLTSGPKVGSLNYPTPQAVPTQQPGIYRRPRRV